jgi:activator of HSP90 ATPase
MATKTFEQTITFKAAPHEVYEAYMDSKKHARFTGSKASISRRVGGVFKAHGGYITGKNVELIPDEKIVQTWIASDWKKGETSEVEFAFSAVTGGTKMKFTHRGVPAKHAAHLRTGWFESYWEPLKAFLAKASKAPIKKRKA